jgi:hypothetical protein
MIKLKSRWQSLGGADHDSEALLRSADRTISRRSKLAYLEKKTYGYRERYEANGRRS